MSQTIYVVAESCEIAMKMRTSLYNLFMSEQQQGQISMDTTFMAAFGMKEITSLLQDAQEPELPDFVRQAERKLMVSFDTPGSDFLDELHAEIRKHPSLEQAMHTSRFSIMPMASIVEGYCKRNDLNRIWVQDPLLESFDDKLAERLRQTELTVCQVDPCAQRMADMRAVRAAALDDDDAELAAAEVERFWQTLQADFAQQNVQAALINNEMSVLVDRRKEANTKPVAINTHLLYSQAILTWVQGNY